MRHHIPEELIPHFLPLFMPLSMVNISFSTVTQIVCHNVILAESLLAQFSQFSVLHRNVTTACTKQV